jgi:hypothetical protein
MDHSPKPNRPIGTKIAPLKQTSAHLTSTHLRVSQRFGDLQDGWRQAKLRLRDATILIDQTSVILFPDGVATNAGDHTDENTYECKPSLP